MSRSHPAVSVVICTRNRETSVLNAVRSVLAGSVQDVECLVVDQGDDTIVSSALGSVAADPRIRYVSTRTRGLSAARNLGLRLALGPIVAMTDDDCEVDAEWIAEIEHAFAADPRIALVFGNVLPAPFDSSRGFIPGYQRRAPFLALGLADKSEVEGMGACMALRRETVNALGGFDERLGAGSALCAGEDVDMTLRVLSAGHAVYETPAIKVTHHRFVSRPDATDLVRGYWLGAGAAIGKHLRRRPAHGLVLLAKLARRFVFGRSRVAESLGPQGLAGARLRAFLRGLGIGVAIGRRGPAKSVAIPDATGAEIQRRS